MTTAPDDAPGFFGKLPARGDFIGRRMGRPFVDAWDSWLQQAILASREALGRTWLEIYLVSPLWRFALGAGACGPRAAAGVVMPSVDAVGRYYPLMLGRELADGVDPAGFLAAAAGWFLALEDMALSTLSDGFDLGALDRPLPLPDTAEPERSGGPAEALPPPGRHFALEGEAAVAAVCRAHAGDAASRSRTIWWTTGSERVAPCLLICPGLPAPSAFASLLDGDWKGRDWSCAAPPSLVAPESGGEPAWDREE